MVYRTNLSVKRKAKQKLAISDFSGGMDTRVSQSLLPMRYAVRMENFQGASGALRHTDGYCPLMLRRGGTLQNVPFDGAILKLFYFKRFDPESEVYDDKLIIYSDDGILYYTDTDGQPGMGFTRLGEVVFSAMPASVNYRLNGADVIIFSSEKDSMLVWDGKNPPYTVADAPNISSACVHYERLFVTVGGEKSAVWFSDDLDPTNWDISLDGAGFIEIADGRGALHRVVQFLDYVYIFRSYGISRLTAYADQTQFSVIPLYVSSGRIFPETIALCGDKIIFMASDGFYSFNGLNTTRILSNVFDAVHPQDGAEAAFYNGKYYLACTLKGSDGSLLPHNNALMQYDVQTLDCSFISGAVVEGLTPVFAEGYSALAISAGGRLCTLGAKNIKPDGAPMLKVWESPRTDFGRPESEKIIREIHLESASDIELVFQSDGGGRRVSVKGKRSLQKINLAVRGREFKVIILCRAEIAEIIKPVIFFDVI